jgi:hypothetical protein
MSEADGLLLSQIGVIAICPPPGLEQNRRSLEARS